MYDKLNQSYHKIPNSYRVIERKFADGSIKFFIEVTMHFDSSVGIDFPTPVILDQDFLWQFAAKKIVNQLKEEEKSFLIVDEKYIDV